MRLRFLLGPAGSGKTHRCRREILAELARAPEGPPLIWLAPKQATFQLERQLLSEPALPGYVRLFILSFERLAEFVLELWNQPPPPVITEEGRVMVLRALLNDPRRPLEVFHSSARLPGFAQELSRVLRELQHHRHSPDRLGRLASQWDGTLAVAAKLRDIARLQREYAAWLEARHLQDVESLLDTATTALAGSASLTGPQIGYLWLDGFAELSPQELALLQALSPFCERMTLAFCLEHAPETDPHWLSTWSTVSQVYRKCYQQLAPAATVVEHEVLARESRTGRFADNPILAHLERHWSAPVAMELPAGQTSIRLAVCAHPEEEVTLAAREIRSHVRQGGRYRDCAVLARGLDRYHEAVRRVFPRYQIPFFLDRRESVAHHPLAELTRYALRLAACDWRHEDWFGALKTGLVPIAEEAIDRLENEALKHGWEGDVWRRAWPDVGASADRGELRRLWAAIVPPFLEFERALAGALSPAQAQPAGLDLARALDGLWRALRVPETLESWSQPVPGPGGGPRPAPASSSQTHLAVWQQMHQWLDNVIQAFPDRRLPLRDWLPIVEAGLSGLTVGVIPPALDQVLVGAIDRSRNPDLHTVLMLGMNESVFPAPPRGGGLFGQPERDELALHGLDLASGERAQLSLERYLAYIACTRARQRLVLTYALAGADGRSLNPSPFIAHLQRLFCARQDPAAAPERAPRVEVFAGCDDWLESEHFGEAIVALNRERPGAILQHWPALSTLLPAPVSWTCAPAEKPRLAPALASQLYGPTLGIGITPLETFAACPFQFFVRVGLRGTERQAYELDPRQQGSFLHAVLAAFHEQLRREGKRWRDIAPAEARRRVRKAALDVARHFSEGLLLRNPENEQATLSLIEGLEEFVEVTVEWMAQYQFDPAAAELAFGTSRAPVASEEEARTRDAASTPPPAGAPVQADLFAPREQPQAEPAILPPWILELSGGHRLAIRGKIDRIDLYPLTAAESLCVVVDYKSREQKLQPVLLSNGLQLQLISYLSYLRQLGAAPAWFGGKKLLPAGAFYLDLQGHYTAAKSRQDAADEAAASRQEAYKHRGRFNLEALPYLDSRPEAKSGTQFSYRLTKEGKPYAHSSDPLPPGQFQELLDHTERLLKTMGDAIFQGEIGVNPYQYRKDRACQRCEFQAICRIDPWTHEFRAIADRSGAGK